ncbi:hypothetical protein MFIFM68171_02870 [Madurella fahalii]|uniref:Uncharacterized protein n=1 Tax=Madurella fahalii TaxID=1157608 RepID=A0ABQ0G521_9PEZI
MLLERLSLSMAALALGGFPNLVQAHPLTSLALITRQPTPSALDYLDLDASGITAKPGTAKCAAVMSWDHVAFPNARIPKSGGYIECRQRLVFENLPAGTDFSFIAAKVSGVLNLDGGSYVDKVEVAIDYLPPPSSPPKPTTTDSASNTTLPYGRSGQPYRGVFNLTMNVWPVDTGPQTARSRSSCVARPELALHLFVSVVNENRDKAAPDDAVASVEQLQVGFYPSWGRCEAPAGMGRG